MKQIHGIFAVTVTHFQENGEIDYAACAKHINWLIESGVHGLLPLGATGEFSALTLEERKAFAEFAMKEVAGRVPVIIGAVSTNVDVTLEVAKHAASIGADGVMILPPPGLHPSQDEIYAFYKHISENVTLPVMIYNNPGSSGVNILPETLDKIADLPHMGFLKESTGDIMRLTRAVDELADRLVIFCGCESLAYESFVMGAKAWVCVLANVAPAQSARLYDLIVNQGKLEEARALYRQNPPPAPPHRGNRRAVADREVHPQAARLRHRHAPPAPPAHFRRREGPARRTARQDRLRLNPPNGEPSPTAPAGPGPRARRRRAPAPGWKPPGKPPAAERPKGTNDEQTRKRGNRRHRGRSRRDRRRLLPRP